MSLDKCINNAEAEGTITQDQADTARNTYQDLFEYYSETMSEEAAASKAAREAFDTLEREAVERKRQKLLQVRATARIIDNIESYKTSLGATDPYEGATALMEQTERSLGFSSIAQRQTAVEGRAMSQMYEVLATFKRDLLGNVRNKAKLNNMVRELFGQKTGDGAASEFAQAWRSSAEYLRKRFNAAGGRIPKRENWGMPQTHDMVKVRKADPESWIDFVLPRLDLDKMVDEVSGLRFTRQSVRTALRDVYETIATDGFNKFEPSGARRGKSLANRRIDHRFLVFKDADSWIEYQDKFGAGEPFSVMMAHIKTMSRDIAQMEILGPNPVASINYLEGYLNKKAALEKNVDIESKAKRSIRNMKLLYNFVTGKEMSPVNTKLASWSAGLRNLLTSAQLGSASIAAITDVNFQRIARASSGLPQTSTIKQYLDFMSPLSGTERGKAAVKQGLIAEGWTSLASAQMRYIGEISGPEITRRISDSVMRMSLLSPITQAGRWAFGQEFLGAIADASGQKFGDLDPSFRGVMQKYGINEAEWDVIRSTDLDESSGASFFSAENLELRGDINPATARELSTRVLEMINTETNFAVPSTSFRGQLPFIGETRPGTIIGETAKSAFMYKNFAVTILNTHLMRGALMPTSGSKFKYMADFIITTTLMGAFAMQLRELAKGRDPRNMDSPEFWGAAFLQGGGLGVYGDFLFSNLNRFDRGLAETVAGPVFGFLNDATNLTAGNIAELVTGEDTNAAKEFVDFASRYTPGASLWYARLALERKVFDQMRIYADPKAKSKMRRLETRYKNEFGQRYWWKPGYEEPSRYPDLEEALGK